MRFGRLFVALVFLLLAALCLASDSFIQLSCYPAAMVADSRSTVTVTARVLLPNGNAVPDGTPILFTTTAGNFRDTVVISRDGYARSVLTAGGLATVAKITATCTTFPATTVMDVDMVSDRSLLSRSKDFVEVISPTNLSMTFDTKVMFASGADHGVKLRYRDMVIEADRIQLDVSTMDLLAYGVHVKCGEINQNFTRLLLNLTSKHGTGIGDFETTVVTGIEPWMDRYIQLKTEKVMRTGFVQVEPSGVSEAKVLPTPDQFTFQAVEDSVAFINAKRAIILPGKEVQFQRADLVVAGKKVVGLPLYQYNLNSTSQSLLGDQVFSINDNHVALNYPYFLSLKPNETSLVRLRTGDGYGQGVGGVSAVNLDYELNWRKDDDSEGNFSLTGLNRSDFSISMRQSLHPSEKSSLNASLDFPAQKSVYGTFTLQQQLTGAQASLNIGANQTLRGLNYSNQSASFVVEKDPMRLGRSRFRAYLGLTADYLNVNNGGIASSQDSMGLRLRTQMDPLRVDPKSTLGFSATFSKLAGNQVSQGLTTQLSMMLSRRVNNQASVSLGYDYVNDAFQASYIGRHRLSLQTYFSGGRTSFSGYITRSLDVARMNTSFDFNYRLSGLWRLSMQNTLTSYLSGGYSDYSVVLGYKMGYRDVGLVWSKLTNRVGIQLLGATY